MRRLARSLGIYSLAFVATWMFTRLTLMVSYRLELLMDSDYWRFFYRFVYQGFWLSTHMVIGNILLITVLMATVYYLKRENSKATFLGSFIYFLPTFLIFAAGMSCLFAGLELLGYFFENFIGVYSTPYRLLKNLYYIGEPFFVPYWLAISASGDTVAEIWGNLPLVRDVYSLSFIALGLLVLFLGVAAWLDAKYNDRTLARSGIYRLSRHPQYLGYILWSYGVLIYSTFRQHPWRVPTEPSLNWVISSMILIGLAYREEISLRKKPDINYGEYSQRVSFLVPLPGFIRRLFSAPFKLIWSGEYPESLREIALTILVVLVILYIPRLFGGLYQYWDPHS